MKTTIARGATSKTSTYSYDAASRLVQATIPRHQLTYSFAPAGGCGMSAAAGLNGNRTSMVDVKDGGAASTTTYCHDQADRLMTSTVTCAPVGANPSPMV